MKGKYNPSYLPFKKEEHHEPATVIKFACSPPLTKGDLGGLFQTIPINHFHHIINLLHHLPII